MTAWRWQRATRAELADLLPGALVVVPVGAVEQHGPHLATGTDTILASTVAERAVDVAADRVRRPIVLTPPVWFGASDHHIPFGGTVSVRPATLLAMLSDVLDSMVAAGATRVLLVNGHGGNVGVCQAAAAAAAVRHDIWVAHTDYWRLLPAGTAACRVPGHAGAFESAMMLAVAPDDVHLDALPAREHDAPLPGNEILPDVDIHGASFWQGMDGYTDDPRRSDLDRGPELLATVVRELADRLVQFAAMA